MESQDTAPGYHIWAVDHSAYGPVELPTLVNWIKDDRVLADTWVYVENDGLWCQASDVPELKMFFKGRIRPTFQRLEPFTADAPVQPGALRRVKALAEMTDDQLANLLKFVEIVRVPPFSHIMRRGEPADAMYGVLEGQLRSCIILEGRECPLANLEPGSIFGEISLFDKGPHAADVISNQESVLMKISAGAVSKLSQEAPDAALGLLSGLIKAIAGRVRTLTRRYQDSVHLSQNAEGIKAA